MFRLRARRDGLVALTWAALVSSALVGLLAGVGFASDRAREMEAQRVARLADIGRVWGFLKYFHPGLAGGQIDVDVMLMELLRSSDPTVSEDAFARAVASMIDQADAGLNGRELKRALAFPDWLLGEPLAQPYVDLRWLESEHIPSALRERLQDIRRAKRPERNHWVSVVRNVRNTDYPNEKDYGDVTDPDRAMRLLGLFRFWNVMQYFFPYRHLIDEDWNDVLIEMIPRFEEVDTLIDY